MRTSLIFPYAGISLWFHTTMNLARKLAENLKVLRGEKSVPEFAKKLGISKSTLYRLEGADQNTTLRTIEQLQMRLNCSAADLLDRNSENEE
ncbi:MAG: helix-turn-helix domain-containing protein [Gammaproteobacteria bacterium]|nr:helix-turn-helix domain-containing protein [Gammaproteobacteria bacterium]MCF6260540.1 helix-turn-helix domain-containing protein [Gammaproteobacteria bacterium]